MPQVSFFHGVTVSLVDVGSRPIEIPSSSIIGIVGVFTPGADTKATPDTATLITTYREAVAAFGPVAPITKALKGVYEQSSAVVVAVGVEAVYTNGVLDTNATISAIIGGVLISGQRTGAQALLDGKPKFNAQPRLLCAPGWSHKQPARATWHYCPALNTDHFNSKRKPP